MTQLSEMEHTFSDGVRFKRSDKLVKARFNFITDILGYEGRLHFIFHRCLNSQAQPLSDVRNLDERY